MRSFVLKAIKAAIVLVLSLIGYLVIHDILTKDRDNMRELKAHFPYLGLTRSLAHKKSQYTPHGCTYTVAEFEAPPPSRFQSPPTPSGKTIFVGMNAWKPTPVDPELYRGAREYCLTSNSGKIDGSLIGGYGPKFDLILKKPGAWFSISGSHEHQILMVYAPREKLIMRMRYGD